MTATKQQKKQEDKGFTPQQVEQRTLGTYYEVVDFANDPIMHMFYSHVKAGLTAYMMDQTGSPEHAMKKYLFMFRRGAALLFKKYGEDYNEFRRELDKRDDLEEHEKLIEEMNKVADLLERRTRKLEIVLHFAKSDVIDYTKEILEKEKEADEKDEELMRDEEEVVISEEEIFDMMEESETEEE